MGSDFFPLLTLKERDRRWNLIRGEMAKRELDCLVIAGDQSNWGGNFANIRYITGIGDIGLAIFPLKGDPILLTWWTAPFEAKQNQETSDLTKSIWANAQKRQPTRNPWALAEPWLSGAHIRQAGPAWGENIVRCLEEFGLAKGRIGLVGTSQNWEPDGIFRATTYLEMQKSLPHAEIVYDATDIFERARLCKSSEEIACTEKAAEIADLGIEVILENAREGVSELEVYSEIVKRMLMAGSERFLMIYWTSGPVPTHVQLFAPPDRPLLKGDIIISEITPRYGGYLAHPHQPVSLGKPLPEIREMYDLLVKTRNDALAKLKPGVTVGEQIDLLTKPLVEAGYSYLHCPFHGLGLAGLEFPNADFVNNSNPVAASPRDMKFEEGMVVAYEPMISTPDRKVGVPLGDTVVITKDGARRLSKYAEDLICV